MKKLLLLGSIAACMVIMMSTNQAIAQEDESSTVHITIKENGKVTTDTTFDLKDGQDPDMVKKMVQHMVGGKVMVFKDEDGNITVKELGEDEEHEMHFKHEGQGDHEIMIIESDEDGEKVKIKKMKKGGGHMMIISEDEHMEWSEEDDENVEVYVIKKGDKDVKVVKKVTVEIEDESEEGEEKEIEVEVKTEKKKKKEKKEK